MSSFAAQPKAVTRALKVVHTASLVDLMRGYARIKTRDDFMPLHLARGPVYTMELALERMRGLLGTADGLDAAGGLAAGGVGGRAGEAALGDGGELRRGAGAGARRVSSSSGRTGRFSRSGSGRQCGRRGHE